MKFDNFEFANYLFKVGCVDKYDLEKCEFPTTSEKIVIIMEVYDNPKIKITNWEYLKSMKDFEYSQIDFVIFSQNTDNSFIIEVMKKYFSKNFLDLLKELDDCDRLSTDSEKEYEPIKNSKCFGEIKNALDDMENLHSKNIAILKNINMKFTKSDDLDIDNIKNSDIITYDLKNHMIHK